MRQSTTSVSSRQRRKKEWILTGILAVCAAATLTQLSEFKLRRVLMLEAVIVLGMIYLWLPWQRMDEALAKRWEKTPGMDRIRSAALLLISPVAAFYIVQCYGAMTDAAFAGVFLTVWGRCNLALYVMIAVLLYAVCNRAKYTCMALVTAASVFGLANYYVMKFRGAPITVSDFAAIGTAFAVADGYDYALGYAAWKGIVCTVVFCCAAAAPQGGRWLGGKKRAVTAVLAVSLLLVLPGSFFDKDFYTSRGMGLGTWDLNKDYTRRGGLLTMAMNYAYYRVEEPEGYSVEAVQEIAQRYPSDDANQNTEGEKPNVIVIMNEAFSDLGTIGKLETSEDYMPFLHGLKKNTYKGKMYVSVRGTRTANSEFEFLTGSSLAFLPPGSVPYNSYIREPVPSITTLMKQQGYADNAAVHPGEYRAWNRDKVYPLLGFEEYIWKNAFADAEQVHMRVSDRACFEYLIQRYEEQRERSDEPFYIFNVTIQNHSGYTDPERLVDVKVQLKNAQDWDEGTEQYLNLVRISDDAFAELTAYFEKVEEPTMIVMFGDHQPSLMPKEEAASYGHEMDLYASSYVVWANYDIGEGEMDISTDYLAAWVMDKAGLSLSGYQKFLLDLSEDVPVITGNGYIGADGEIYDLDQDSPYVEQIKEYRILQYNNISDKGNRAESFFCLAE